MTPPDESGNDVFLSYATLDDSPFGSAQRGWVSFLRDALDVRLSQLTGQRASIIMDREVPIRQALGPVLEDALRKSRTFLPVVSPAYLQSENCLRELRYFLAAVGPNLPGASQRLRIFEVIKDPVPFAELPDPLDTIVGYQFFQTDPVSDRIRSYDPKGPEDSADRFWLTVDHLAQDIARALGTIRRAQRIPSFPEVGSSSTTEGDHPKFEIVERSRDRRPLRAFLCHSSADKPRVRDLFRRLAHDGCDPWLDEEKLLPGQKWEEEIPRAVRDSDVVIVCMSRGATAKRGYLQKEITFALDVAMEEPERSVFLIPARLEECEVPDRLKEYQWVNLYEHNGYARLLTALQAKATRRSIESAG